MIKNIIFDIGEILLSYRWTYALEMSGLSEAEGNRVGNLIFSDRLWYELDAGNIMLEEAKRLYREKYPEDARSISFFLDHPEMMPLDRKEVWAYLPKLRAAGYKLYVLSNYGKELFDMHVLKAPFWKDIDGGVISYTVHVCKPDEKIYRILLDKYDLKAEECLFFDDRPENVEGALNCGFNSRCIQTEAELTGELDRLLAEANG